METVPARPYPRWLVPLLLGLVLVAGIWLRLPSPSDAEIKGFDESIYVRYVNVLRQHGLTSFPRLCAEYLRVQADNQAFLPPTRILFLSAGTLWANGTGISAVESVRTISFVSACLTLVLGAIWAWRLGGPVTALGVSALLACAPTQIHMAHRALIDGFFGFLAMLTLWGLWEALRAPEKKRWLLVYGVGLAAMVLTKENAFFVFVAICGILAVNRWGVTIGTATSRLYLVTLAAPAVAAMLLMLAAGGPSILMAVYRLNVEKSKVLPYAIATGDGPWFRYLLDLLAVSPFVLVLAISSLGKWNAGDRVRVLFVSFVAFTYVVMCQVKYGMNLRYGNMWDLPLRWLAFAQIKDWVTLAPQSLRAGLCALALTAVCAGELQQYNVLFVENRIYDPTPAALTRALDLVKIEKQAPVSVR